MSAAAKTAGNRYAMLGVLLLVLVISQVWAQSRRAAKRARAASAAPAPPVPSVPQAASQASVAASPQSLAALRAAPWGEDPFWKSAAAAFRAPRARAAGGGAAREPGAPAFTLRGILSGGGTTSAQINEAIVQPGDVVEGWTVETIENNTVTLSRKGAHVTLHLHEVRP